MNAEFTLLQIVNVLIMTQNSPVRAKERTLMTAPDEKTLASLTKLFEEEFCPIGDRQVLYVPVSYTHLTLPTKA